MSSPWIPPAPTQLSKPFADEMDWDDFVKGEHCRDFPDESIARFINQMRQCIMQESHWSYSRSPTATVSPPPLPPHESSITLPRQPAVQRHKHTRPPPCL